MVEDNREIKRLNPTGIDFNKGDIPGVVKKGSMGYEIYRENKAYEFGLVNIYAYHCYHCNYTWLPRDFDFNWNYKSSKSDGYFGHDLFYREPPRSCARCKSKSWKENIPNRKPRSNNRIFENEGMNKLIDGRPWIGSRARLRALFRQTKKDSLSAKEILQWD